MNKHPRTSIFGGEPTVRQSISFAQDQHAALCEIAAKNNVSLCWIVRHACRLYLESDDCQLVISDKTAALNKNGCTTMTTSLWTMASFFSGIGGFDLAFERAGFRITMQCEINSFCNQILAKHWPETTRHTDICEVKSAEIPESDVWAGGFPCQDVSLARMGPRDGLKGKRSGLFYQFARLVGERLPRAIVIETFRAYCLRTKDATSKSLFKRWPTSGMLSDGVCLTADTSEFPSRVSESTLLDVIEVGEVPERYFLSPNAAAGILRRADRMGRSLFPPLRKALEILSKGPVVQGLAYCLYACSARHTGTDWSRTYVTYPRGRVRRLMPNECEGIQGFPLGWTLPDNPPDDPERLDSLRYTALGNAVTVPAVEWIAGRILSSLEAARNRNLTPDEDESLQTEQGLLHNPSVSSLRSMSGRGLKA